MTVDTTRAPWIREAERMMEFLQDVEGVSIQAEGDDVREIHVLARSGRAPKQIVRDIQSVLQTKFRRTIDHRVVSVAFMKPTRGGTEAHEEPARPAQPVAPEPTATAVERIRYGGANVYISGSRVQAQVELRWKGVSRMGSASGLGTREGAHRLIAAATLAAVQEFLEGEVALSLEGVDFVQIGRHQVVAVALDLLAYREQKSLVGCCTVEQDAQQAVVLATLSAINRVVGGLETREPTEYVLRPASAWKESEAK